MPNLLNLIKIEKSYHLPGCSNHMLAPALVVFQIVASRRRLRRRKTKNNDVIINFMDLKSWPSEPRPCWRTERWLSGLFINVFCSRCYFHCHPSFLPEFSSAPHSLECPFPELVRTCHTLGVPRNSAWWRRRHIISCHCFVKTAPTSVSLNGQRLILALFFIAI